MRGLGVGTLALALTPTPAGAGNGTIEVDDGVIEVDLKVGLGYPVTQDQLALIGTQFRRASSILCDATDGRLRIRRVRIGDTPLTTQQADVYLQPPGATGNSTGTSDIPFGTEGNRARISTPASGIEPGVATGQLMAHELGHSILGLDDAYDSQNRWGKGYGFGRALDITPTTTDTNLMGEQPQRCYNSADLMMLGPGDPLPAPRENVEEKGTTCFANSSCKPGDVCPFAGPENTELLIASNFDSLQGDDTLGSAAPGKYLVLQGYVMTDTPEVSGDPPIGWAGFGSLAEADAVASMGREEREYVDKTGDLDGTYRAKKAGEYVLGSHKIVFYMSHWEDDAAADIDEWHLYAYLADGGEAYPSGTGTEGEPLLLEWQVGANTEEYLKLEFDKTSTITTYKLEPDSCNTSPCSKIDISCYELLRAGGQAVVDDGSGAATPLEMIDVPGGEDPVTLTIPDLRDDPGGVVGEDIELRFNADDGVFWGSNSRRNLFGACQFDPPLASLPEMPVYDLSVDDGDPGNLKEADWDDSDYREYYGTRFAGFVGGELVQQVGDCTIGSDCDTDGFRANWADGSKRFESALQRMQNAQTYVPELIAEKEAGEEPDGWSARGFIMDENTFEPEPGDDWSLFAYNMARRHEITVSPPANVTWDSVGTDPVCADAFGHLDWDTSNLGFPDNLVIMVDASASMKTEVKSGVTAQSRLNWAKDAVKGFGRVMQASAAGQAVKVSVVRFASPWGEGYEATTGMDEVVAPMQILDEAALGVFEQLVDDDLEIMTGKTAVWDALNSQAATLPLTTNGETAIMLLSDGDDNASGTSMEFARDNLLAADIPVYYTPIGNDFPFDEETALAKGTGGGLVEVASDPRMLPHAFFKQAAFMQAIDLYWAEPKFSEVADALQGYPTQVVYPLVAPAAAARMNILLTNMVDDLQTWAPEFRLDGPLGEVITQATPGAWSTTPYTALISVDNPSPGPWTLTIVAPDSGENPKLVPESQLASVFFEDASIRCDAVATPKLVEDDRGVRIWARASVDGHTVAGVAYSATVTRPDGSTKQVSLVERGFEGATGWFNELWGKGPYKVAVTCDGSAGGLRASPGEDSDPITGENPTPVVEPAPFVAGATDGFYAELDEYYLPDTADNDCDGDGFLDVEEGRVLGGGPWVHFSVLPDTDGDGLADVCDGDSDSDDLPDRDEAHADTDFDGAEDRIDVDSDDDGDLDGIDEDPLNADAHWWVARGDFDGDGRTDRAEGDLSYASYRGRVHVEYGDGSSEDYNGVSTGDYFGSAVTAGDIDGDGYDDLVIGAPGDDVNGQANAGSLLALYGTSTGLTMVGYQILHQDSYGIAGACEAYDYFADRLAMGDYDGDGYMDVTIGVPREAIGSNSDAGAVQVFYGSAGGISTTDDLWRQGINGVNGAAESYDRFGDAVLAANFDNDAYDDLVVGIPREHIGSTSDAGMVWVAYGTSTGIETQGDFAYSQNTGGAAETSQAYDNLGKRFWVNDRNGDGYPDLTAFVPGDGCGAGSKGFQVTYGGSGGLTLSGNFVQCADAYHLGL